MMAAMASAIAEDHSSSYARLVGRVGGLGWDDLSIRWSEVLAARMCTSADQLRLSIDIDLALEGR